MLYTAETADHNKTMVTVVTLRALLFASLLASSDALVTKRQATYTYLGCRTDSVQNRVLTGKSTAYDTMTIQSCQADCAGFTYAGIEYGRECKVIYENYLE